MRKKKKKGEKYFLPALFSGLVIGLGQVVKGDSGRGLLWMLFFYFFLPALTYTALMIHAYPFLLLLVIEIFLYPIFWLYNVRDAYSRRIH